jgi:hypothetical protein
MPIAIAQKIYRSEELVEYITDLIENSELPFAYIAKYNERLIPQYPAVQIQPGVLTEEPHATHTRLVGLHAFLYVMHAKMTIGTQSRTLEDLLLVTQLKDLLEQDVTFGGRIIHGFIDEETPAVFPPRAPKSDIIVGTRMSWSGVQQRRWR